MAFSSILFKNKTALISETPAFFVDLNLVQVINTVIHGKEQYNLKPFFNTCLRDPEAIVYRQETMKDMEKDELFNCLTAFATRMYAMRQQLPNPKANNYKYQDERFLLDAVNTYSTAIHSLSGDLAPMNIKSSGLLAFREYLVRYIQSPVFTSLFNDTQKLLTDLSSIKYCVLAKELKVQVASYREETDYSAEVERTFEKFKREAIKDYSMKFTPNLQMNHVEASILEGVAQLYPLVFQQLSDFCTKYADFQDETIITFDREIQFYIAWLEFISKLKQSGLSFSYPEITSNNKNIYSHEGFDVALAYKLVKENKPIVCNDFYLKNEERIFIVSGPNQGGKTTFARTFGQLHFLAALGCLVPGREAKLFLFDRLFTHFEKQENITNLRSKLEDDLIRIHNIVQQATTNSIIIMNEILSSTTLQDAVFLSKKLMEKIDRLDVLCVWVTFIDELLSFSEKTVSVVSTVEPDNSTIRTFKIERKPADGLAFALSIAEKYHVTYSALRNRIKL
ncbi:DNA mismatch repair protein MutS [Niastella vici]|uniref:DNA mismatch repair protein MutS n=1 Tax=Niastella vici TaxID=1703345 RepID=A0A1V9FPF8_9BACT|nr:DNA mismatch repair protein MutS [Niastella vici]OQP60187.1 DNA mismatch repair protein MutS [Niastella vici]